MEAEPASISTEKVLERTPVGPGGGTLQWSQCQGEELTQFECSTLEVPLDRTGVDPGTVKLPVIRAQATGPEEERLGSIFFNPGGPGGSGLKFFPLVHDLTPPRIAQHYDLVSWDPRGIGQAVPSIDCEMPWVERDDAGTPLSEIDWPKVFAAHVERARKANRECQAKYSDVIEHLGTMNVVEDLDALREAVGDEKLTYAGFSYGTRIGSVYAQVHPDRVGAMLLDGSVDPSGSIEGFIADGARAVDEAYGHLRQVDPDGQAKTARAIDVLTRENIPLGGGTEFTRSDFLDQILLWMTLQRDTPKIAQLAEHVLAAAADRNDESARDALRDSMDSIGPNEDTGGPVAVVNCLDYEDRPSMSRLTGIVAENARRAPMFGGALTTSYASTCAGLTFEPDPIPNKRGIISDFPVLIGGATRDARTPFQWSVQMAKAFPESRLVTYSGGNHVNWLTESECVNEYYDAYFVDGELPVVDVECGYTPNSTQTG